MSANEDPSGSGRPSASLAPRRRSYLVGAEAADFTGPGPPRSPSNSGDCRTVFGGTTRLTTCSESRGYPIPQLVLWEKFVDRAAKGCTSAFMTPTPFVAPIVTRDRRTSSSGRAKLGGDMTAALHSTAPRSFGR